MACTRNQSSKSGPCLRSKKCVRHAVAWGGLLFIEQPSAAQAPTGDEIGEEIIVTAQRRPERPQDVPISLTVVSGKQLDRMQATDMADLGKVVPGLVVTRTGAFTQPYLRGVGKRSTLGVENGVATYVDGVYLASSIGVLLDLRGIERIEVLEGPQGTLFGRNTTGGVIQVVTRDPGSQSSGEVAVHAGTYGHVRGDAFLSGGNDRLAANLAMSLSRNDGYGTNFFTGKTDQGETDYNFTARSKWVWRPAGSLKITVAGDYQSVDQDFSYRPVAGFPAIGQPRVTGFRDGDQDSPVPHRFRYGGGSIRVDKEIGGLTFMSLSALRGMKAGFGNDLDQGPHALWSADVSVRQDQFSQEFQLQSPESSRLRWVAGLYYIHVGERYDPTIFEYGGSYSQRLGGRVRQTLYSRGKVSSYAAYGQATIPVAQATRLTLGLRYTIEQRSVRANGEQQFDNFPFVRPIPGLPLPTENPLRDKQTFQEPTWRVSLAHQFADGVMGYVSTSRGFQSGGWNLQTPQSPAFAPEHLDAFEAGVKFLDRSRRVSLEASAFYYDYSDLQLSAFTPIGSVTANAASAEAYGLGLRLDARLDPNTDVMLGLQLQKTRFKEFRNAFCLDYSPVAVVPYAPQSCDVTGNDLPFAPELKFNAGATRRIPLGRGALVLSGNVAYNSGYYSEADNVARQKPFATVDASAEWQPGLKGLSLRLWVLNLTDVNYYSSLATVATAGVLQSPAAPRRFGTTVAFAF